MKRQMIMGVFLVLIVGVPGMLTAETTAAPVPNPTGTAEERREQARHSDALGKASTVSVGQSSTATVTTYDQLVAAIRKARAASQARVEQAVAQEKVRECWETGKLIDEHVLQHKERADYGKQVILRLSQDLSISDSELYYMLEFARTYPISQPAGKLSWSHYVELLSLKDVEEQVAVADMAEKGNWTRDQIREEIKKRKAARGLTGTEKGSDPFSAEKKLTAKLGKVGTYRMVKATVGPETGKVVIDLGFSNYYRTSRPLGFKEGAIIEALFALPEGSSPSDKIKLSKRTSADLYTYRAYVHRVLDGDTIEAVIDLGFGVRSVQTLRLRGIDAPEMVSKEGKEAKAFLEKELRITEAEKQEKSLPLASDLSASPVLIRTVKSDKYDRYLADVFMDGLCLNQALVEKGLAVRVRDN
ncbi:MAG: DUF1016 N-terminal domain-containing protein [Candidatus Omnitrophota bacterium]